MEKKETSTFHSRMESNFLILTGTYADQLKTKREILKKAPSQWVD
jgi:hypothetical protein